MTVNTTLKEAAMPTTQEWATRLAQEVAPGEVALAPLVVEAFLRGGQDKEDLFRRRERTVAEFTAGEVIALLPLLCKALAAAAPLLKALLTSPHSGTFLDQIKGLLQPQSTAPASPSVT